MKYKTLKPAAKEKFINNAKMMFFAHRDCLWNRYSLHLEGITVGKVVPPNVIQLDASEGFYGEFFGMFRTLEVLGYGYFGADSSEEEFNLKNWAYRIEKECLKEEDYKNSNKENCYKLLEKYRELCKNKITF